MCARRCKYAFVDKIQPMTKAEALDKGGLLHELLKVHYIVIMKDYERLLKLETFKPLKIENIQPPVVADFTEVDLEELRESSIQQLVKKHYDYITTSIDLPIEICEEVYKTYSQYAQYYNNDGWFPIAIENPFSKLLFEDTDLCILYEGITDLVTQNLIVDHKSSSRRGEPLSLSNQFIGYAWALGINNVIINKVGFQKTLEPKDKFERYTKSYTKDMIEEWRINTIAWALKLFYHLSNLDEMEQDTNFTSCDKYGGCIYASICETEREARSWKIQNNFKIGEEWSPAKELEK